MKLAEADLSVTINGATVSLLDCFWILYAPCGCMAGATVTGLRDPKCKTRVKATEADAWEAMYENKLERDREQKRGFTFELITREQYSDLIKEPRCAHDPIWGVPPIPKPEGRVWAVSGDGPGIYPSKSARLHLVLTDHSEETWAQRVACDHAHHEALCGSKSRRWRNEWPAVDGQVECTRCVKAAGGAA